MAGNSKSSNQIYRLVVMALMAAMVYLGTIIRIPLGNSKVHIANAICVFAGFILNPLDAGIAAGKFDPMIVVIPNSSEESWWRGDWEKMITEELIPERTQGQPALTESEQIQMEEVYSG